MQRSVLITGCSSGIGACAAHFLHLRGYQVLAACRKDKDVEQAFLLGWHGIKLDLNDSFSIQRAVEQTLSVSHGRLYAVFNNAGYAVYGALAQVTRQELEQQFATNLFGVHELTQLLLPTLLQQGYGRIIQTSSVLGFISPPRRGPYSASKHALEAWSDCLRRELEGSGVSVSLIEPGPIMTQFDANVQLAKGNTPLHYSPLVRRLALPPSAILPKLTHALESKQPKSRYRVTLVTQVAAWLKRILSDACLDRLLREPHNR